jgi:hypothetical protein
METKVSVGNLATIAVLASSKDVPLTSFTLELQHSLTAIGKCHDRPYQIGDYINQACGFWEYILTFLHLNSFKMFLLW